MTQSPQVGRWSGHRSPLVLSRKEPSGCVWVMHDGMDLISLPFFSPDFSLFPLDQDGYHCRDTMEYVSRWTAKDHSCPVLFPDGFPWLVAIHSFSFPSLPSPLIFSGPCAHSTFFLFCSRGVCFPSSGSLAVLRFILLSRSSL